MWGRKGRGVKHARKTAAAIAGLAAILAGAPTALGRDVQFAEWVISTEMPGAHSVFTADLDGDGDIDVIAVSGRDDKTVWYENDGGSPPTFTERVISTNGIRPYSVVAADMDGDGDIDVICASESDDKIAWHENDGGSPPTFTERVISTNADIAHSVLAADMDGDGDIDVVSASQLDDKIAWYESDGGSPPAFIERVISTTADAASSVFAADIDGDGDIDLLSASRLDDKIAWYENDGASPPTFTERVISITSDGAHSVFAADMDGDGDTDVLCASLYADSITWHENDGASPPTFTERVISTNADGASYAFATDLNRDGDIDVLSASRFDDKISWYESDGGSPPSFIEHVISTDADYAIFVFAADVDGDGDMDVLSASATGRKIAWYENRIPPPDCSGVNDCSGQGTCVDNNTCDCDAGWTDSDCSMFACDAVNDCSGNGTCVGPNVCECAEEYAGPSCSVAIPAVSQWGLMIMALLLACGGTVLLDRRRATAPVPARNSR